MVQEKKEDKMRSELKEVIVRHPLVARARKGPCLCSHDQREQRKWWHLLRRHCDGHCKLLCLV